MTFDASEFRLTEPAAARIGLMRGLMNDRHHRLHFPGALESQFRAWQTDASRTSRVVMAVAVVIIFVCNTAFEFALLRPDAGFAPAAHWLQWGVEVPLTVIAMLVHLRDRWRRYWDATLLVAGFVIALCVQAQRLFDLTWGFEMPALFAPIIIAIGALASRLRFWTALPAVISFFVLWSLSEVLRFGVDDITMLHNLFVGFILLMGTLISLHGLEVQARFAWLQREWNAMMAETDPMTLLPNRRGLNRFVERLMSLSEREHQHVAMAVIDIDRFKAFNDTYGHSAGDDCICQVADALASQARRPMDLAARLGGEEFVLIWYGRDPASLESAAHDCARAVYDLAIPHRHGIDGRVTVSVGAVSVAEESPPIFERLYSAGDSELYQAKMTGRNRVSVRHLHKSTPAGVAS